MQKAVDALLTHEKLVAAREAERVAGAGHKRKKALLGEETADGQSTDACVWLLVGVNKMAAKASAKPVRLVIPHPWRTAGEDASRVCVITKDPQRTFKDLISPLKIAPITKVLGVSKLRQKFKPFEAKRQLCNSFDLFLADARILPLLPKLIGKTFFLKKKHPVPVDLSSTKPDTLARELREAVESTYLHLNGGPSTAVRVGTSGMDKDLIAQNVEAVVKHLAKRLPGGLANIRTLHIKTAASVSLPIYVRDGAAPAPETATDSASSSK